MITIPPSSLDKGGDRENDIYKKGFFYSTELKAGVINGSGIGVLTRP